MKKLFIGLLALISLSAFAQESSARKIWNEILITDSQNFSNMRQQLLIADAHIENLSSCSFNYYHQTLNDGPRSANISLECSFSDKSKISVLLDEKDLGEEFNLLRKKVFSITRAQRTFDDAFKKSITSRQFRKILKLSLLDNIKVISVLSESPWSGESWTIFSRI